MVKEIKRKRQMVTFYIRDDYKIIFDTFEELIEDDPEFTKLKRHSKSGIIGPVIIQLIAKYVKAKTLNQTPPTEEINEGDSNAEED